MKNSIKSIILTFVLFFILATNLFSQSIGDGEFMIVNQTGTSTGYSISVKIYPVGAIFNGGDEYTVDAANKISLTNKYIFGTEISISNVQSGSGWYALANFDKSEQRQNCQFSLGYGRYRIDFYEGTTKTNTCDVDFSDANFTGQDVTGYIQHLRIDYNNSNDISFQFIGENTEAVNINDVNKYIKVWEQIGTENNPQTPSKGNFTDSQDPASQYHSFPLDATSFGHFAHVTPENVSMNLKVANYNSNIKSNNTFNINDCIFILDANKTFTVNGGQGNTTQMNVTGTQGKLETNQYSTLIFPPNFQLNITDGACISSNYTTFTSPNSSTIWQGIYMENAYNSVFSHCTFNNANTAIY